MLKANLPLAHGFLMLLCSMRIKAIIFSHIYSKIVGLVGGQLKLFCFNTKGELGV